MGIGKHQRKVRGILFFLGGSSPKKKEDSLKAVGQRSYTDRPGGAFGDAML
jgi:hypothetical protein